MAAAAWDLNDSSARPGLELTVHMPVTGLQSKDKGSGKRAGGAVEAAGGGAGGAAGVTVGGEDVVHS